jgi:hypothetical protein
MNWLGAIRFIFFVGAEVVLGRFKLWLKYDAPPEAGERTRGRSFFIEK